jgi:signal transduction histidine kinase
MLKKPFHDIEVMQLASTLMQKWFLARQAAMQFEQTEALVVQRTQKLLEFHRREHQQIRELDQTKLRHLAKLADEFRGPLAVMLHSFENTGAGTPLNQRALELVQQNIRMLLQMVDDSLSMRRFELEDRQLDWRETEIVGFLRGLVQMFAAGAHERRIEMNFEPEANSKVIWTDPVKLEKALFNILASALAAAADRSVIEISLHFGEATLKPGNSPLAGRRSDGGSLESSQGRRAVRVEDARYTCGNQTRIARGGYSQPHRKEYDGAKSPGRQRLAGYSVDRRKCGYPDVYLSGAGRRL